MEVPVVVLQIYSVLGRTLVGSSRTRQSVMRRQADQLVQNGWEPVDVVAEEDLVKNP